MSVHPSLRSRRAFLVGAAAASGLLAACGTSSPKPGNSASASTVDLSRPLSPGRTVRVADLKLSSEGGLYFALARGYFREQGLTISLTPVEGASDQVALLARGVLDIGAGQPTAGLFNAGSRNIPIAIVADWVEITPGNASAGIVVRKKFVDSGRYRSLSDLAGLTLAVNDQSGLQQYELEQLLKKAGVPSGRVSVQVIPYTDMLPALATVALTWPSLWSPISRSPNRRGLARWPRRLAATSPDRPPSCWPALR